MDSLEIHKYLLQSYYTYAMDIPLAIKHITGQKKRLQIKVLENLMRKSVDEIYPLVHTLVLLQFAIQAMAHLVR